MPTSPRPAVNTEMTRHNYVSTLDVINDLHKPEVDPNLRNRYGDQNLTGLFRIMGAMKAVSQQEYRHYEENWLHENIQVNDAVAESPAAPGAGVAATYEIASGDVYGVVDSQVNSPYYVVDQNGDTVLPRVNDIVMFPVAGGKNVRAQVTAVNPATPSVTFRPLKTTDSLPTAASLAGKKIALIGNSWNEGSSGTTSRNGTVIPYVNNLSIQKGAHKVTGTEMGQVLWIEVEGQWYWYVKGQKDEYHRFMNEMETMWMFGDKYTNADAANATNTVTEGYFTFVENYGNNQTYSGVTGITEADLQNSVKTLEKYRGSKENVLLAGINASLDVDNLWKGVFDNGAISYGTFNYKQDLAVAMQFDAFKISNYEFYKKVYDPFNYDKMLGADGMGFQDVMMVMPTDKSNGSEGGYVRVNYLTYGDGRSRYYEEFPIGGANGIYNTDEDSLTIHMRSHTGIEAFAPNKHMIIRKA